MEGVLIDRQMNENQFHCQPTNNDRKNSLGSSGLKQIDQQGEITCCLKLETSLWHNYRPLLKAMLHEAIFLVTCNATMTNKKHFKLQRGCHTFATFFATCNAYNNKQDGGRPKSPLSCER